MRKFDSDGNKILFLNNACNNCCLRPGRYYTIEDIWNTFGFNWDVATAPDALPTLNLQVLEKFAVAIALKETNFSQKNAAKKLGITKRMMFSLVEKYKITSTKWNKHKAAENESTEELFNKGIDLFEWAKGEIILCKKEEA